MSSPDTSRNASLKAAVADLNSSGNSSHAASLVGVWEVCLGGCGFNMNAEESEMACRVSKLMFSDPSSVRLVFLSATSRLSSPALMEEMRLLAREELPRR